MAGKKKDYITCNEFLNHLERQTLGALYLFQGQETFLMEECLERVKQTLLQSEAADFNFDKFSAGNLEIGHLLDLAQTMPFLSQKRLIILTESHELKTPAQKQLLPYLADPNPSTCFIMTTTGKLDSRTKFAQAVAKHGKTVQFWKPFDRDIPAWIRRRASQYGYTMQSQAADSLLAFVGNDLRQLDNELKKIIAYASTKEISSAIVGQVTGDIRERDIFELVDAIGKGNIIESLRILNQLLIEGEQPLRILAMIIRQFRLLWKTKAWLVEQKNLPSTQLTGKIGVPLRSAEALQKQVHRFSQLKLKQAMKRLSEVDRALKTSTNSPQILLEDLCIDLCR
ncbi:DNA polymerase III subunit delta [candidate division KSB3 bacterium]|uniref:DNA polymerase III subunit delta n=1 Tax=candidate division KSB3 bacterium TaxID=2044937 RepID=A0A2G6KE02_9BACT|nr:MAG: DNA polymerase III subunit delta [candidate division KSB3 bacterium]